MAKTTVSLEEFQKDAERVDKASSEGPVFITRPGRKTLVVPDIEEYQKLSVKKPSIVISSPILAQVRWISSLRAWVQNLIGQWTCLTNRACT